VNPEPTVVSARDIVVIGASAGGVTALREIVQALPAGFPAAVFIVLHISRDTPSLLGEILGQVGTLPVRNAADGDPVQPGTIYVAERDHHLVLKDGRVRVLFGPKQDHHRPSIDVLFRSAAWQYGPRVIGVVLTGFLSDGTAGLHAIKQAGGVAVVQDPNTAMYRGMPESALRAVTVDYCVGLSEIPALLVHLTGPFKAEPAVARSSALRLETEADLGNVGDLAQIAEPSSYLCPDCGGALWEVRSDELPRFRCRVGHGYSVESLLSSQQPYVERALWAAARSLEDRAALARRLADAWRERNAAAVVDHFARSADQSSEHASIIRSFLGSASTDDGG
jgi:two-component system, chemotaxis family, protein-glutamate methylesterase/glutaminase